MSDHLPMWVELRIDFGREYLDRKLQSSGGMEGEWPDGPVAEQEEEQQLEVVMNAEPQVPPARQTDLGEKISTGTYLNG